MRSILVTIIALMVSTTAAQAADAPVSLTTRFTKRTIINQANAIHKFRKQAPSSVNQQRYLPSTGYNGRFLLQKSRLQSGTVGNVYQAKIRRERDGMYRNTLSEFTKMSKDSTVDTRKYTVRLNPRSVRSN